MRWLYVLAITGFLAGCSGGALSFLTGGGPNVAANVQAGRTNTQTVGQTVLNENRLGRAQASTIRQGETSEVSADKVDQVTVNHTNPYWLFAAFFLGGLLMKSPLDRLWDWRDRRRQRTPAAPAVVIPAAETAREPRSSSSKVLEWPI